MLLSVRCGKGGVEQVRVVVTFSGSIIYQEGESLQQVILKYIPAGAVMGEELNHT